jgi:transposase, IS5 family
MLRVYYLQQWFNLSDPGMEEALYESPVLRRFAGVDLGVSAAPDETTILRFRHLLEQHDLDGQVLNAVNGHLADKGIRITTGTIVDATILHAPSSTKNSTGERDPQMHQTRKGNQWYFGLKAHIGVDSKEGVVHSVGTSAGDVEEVRVPFHRILDGHPVTRSSLNVGTSNHLVLYATSPVFGIPLGAKSLNRGWPA